MFWLMRFTSKATSASASMPSVVNLSVRPSVASSSAYCFVRACFGFLLEQDPAGLADLHLATLILLRHQLLEHGLEIDVHLLHAQIREDADRHGLLLHGERDMAILEVAGLELGLHLLASALAALV